MVAGIAFFPEWKWIVVSQADVEDYYDAILAMKIQTVFIAAMAILAGVCIAYFFGLSVSRPVHTLLGALKCVAEGDFTQAAGIKSRIREMNSMSEQVDSMIAKLSGTVHLAEKVAQGDLTVQVNQLSDRDALGHALKTMVAKLSGMLSEIAMSAGNVSAGAEQMNATSQAMSQGATEQAGSLEEITSSMNEITSQVRQNAEHAAQANRLADEARASAEQGNGQVSEMVASMKGISESSRNISRIIKVIDEIAFQTNLLALNAAVEAARAGRHGKGFAVVAEEVRSLAARSAQAAKETSEMIEEAVRKIESGTSMADRTAAALQEIVHAARKVTGLVGEIAAASSEQSHGVAQISQGLGQIDQVTQQNTAHAEESASAAEELASQSMILQQYVSMFKVTEAQMKRPRQADTAERATGRMLEPMMHHAGLLKNMTAVVDGHGNGNGNGNGKTGWGGLMQTDAVPPPVIQLDDQDFGKY
ncbi:MAG: chemotaxis protein [Deltaproteobacteria bacterium]|nr:chemotaxis protein [Deltaproteobacteria bacterium]